MAPAQKPIFNGLVIAVACHLGGQWTDTNISRWVGQRCGAFASQMDDSVTHLLCTSDEFKKRGPRVKQALKRGVKACRVVTVDWLEDSIIKNKRLPEKPYELSVALREEKAKQRLSEREVKGFEQAEKFVNQNLYHVYADQTYFRYEVTLTRDDAEHGQRYKLFLFESNAKPHLYWFAAKFYKKRHDSQPKFHRPSDTPHLFHAEFLRFATFFQKKAGIPWEERLVRAGTVGREFFSYAPPTGGKPVGFVPECFLLPDPEEAKTEGDSINGVISTAPNTATEEESSLPQQRSNPGNAPLLGADEDAASPSCITSPGPAAAITPPLRVDEECRDDGVIIGAAPGNIPARPEIPPDPDKEMTPEVSVVE